MFKDNNYKINNTRASDNNDAVLVSLSWTLKTPFSSVSINGFEQVNVFWVYV